MMKFQYQAKPSSIQAKQYQVLSHESMAPTRTLVRPEGNNPAPPPHSKHVIVVSSIL